MVLALTLSTLLAVAQQRVAFAFDATEYDFGTVRESDGAVSHTFRFVNTGEAPLTVQSVTASCGCTATEWTQTAVLPSDSGFVSLTFDPSNRPGRFAKSARVTFAGAQATFVAMLDIFGVVESADVAHSACLYRFGPICMPAAEVAFDTLKKDDVATRKMTMVNVADEPLRLTFDAPDFVEIDAPAVIKPAEELTIGLTYFARSNPHWGRTSADVVIGTNGKMVGAFGVSAVLVEDFGELTAADSLAAPVASLSQAELDFGTLKIGKKHKKTLVLTNLGLNPLQVRAIVSENDYLCATSSKKVLKNGQKAIVKIEIDATALQPYVYRRTLRLITNDPLVPEREIVVVWKLER